MPSLNKAILIGNVGKDPEVRTLPGGDLVASFSLATTEKWKDKDGNKRERTEWHRIEVFGNTAKVVQDYVLKGKPLYIEGQIRYEEWTDKDGNKRNTTKVRVGNHGSKLLLLGWRDGESKPTHSQSAPQQEFVATDDDVPF